MKTILSILLVLFSGSLFGQKIRFTDSRNQWTTNGTSGIDGCPFQHIIYFGSDTLIHGNTYKPVKDDMSIIFSYPAFSGCSGTGGFSLNNYFWVREDSSAGIVYYRSAFGPSPDTLEHILYNYNLHVGDSISFGSLTDTVASIDSTIINGVYHRIFNFQNTAMGICVPTLF